MQKQKTILIAPNSYKECADSVDAAELFAKYLRNNRLKLLISPLSDGGDGFLKVCTKHFNLELLEYTVSSPFSSQIEVKAGYDLTAKTAYIESAEVLGIRRIPQDKRDPMQLSSKGMGELIKKILAEHIIDKFVIGIGGTGTNDLGLGMLTELGLKLYDLNGKTVQPLPQTFSKINNVRWDGSLNFDVKVIVDVDNPLTGSEGSSRIYGPQKGLNEENIDFIDKEFLRLVNLFRTDSFINDEIILSGAGGGLAAGFQMFLNAEVQKAADFILQDLRMKENLSKADYVITGEGAFDEQSLSGKASGILIRNTKLPLFLVCGKIQTDISLPDNVIPIELQKYFSNPEESITKFTEGIRNASEEIKNIYRNIYS